MSPSAYLRHPSLHGDTVVFVSDDDIWRASVHGGVATRLTAGLSEPSTPCLSPDGRWIAYYHPGELSDAWADGHAGVRTEVWQACYMLGVNIMFYAHREYGQWLLAQKSN